MDFKIRKVGSEFVYGGIITNNLGELYYKIGYIMIVKIPAFWPNLSAMSLARTGNSYFILVLF